MSACTSCGRAGSAAASRRPIAAHGFRVSVDLGRYFPPGSVRARCWVWVPLAGARRVRWLAQRLRRLFHLPGALVLAAGGHLLPEDEPLSLLRPSDTLQVIPMEDESDETLNGMEEIVQNKVTKQKIVSDNSITDLSDTDNRNDVRSQDTTDVELGNDECDTGYNQRLDNDPDDRLVQLKRRALAMLESLEPSSRDAPEGEPPARRPRRRVRRRRRHNALSPNTTTEHLGDAEVVPTVSTCDKFREVPADIVCNLDKPTRLVSHTSNVDTLTSVVHKRDAPTKVVVRNPEGTATPARLVRALC